MAGFAGTSCPDLLLQAVRTRYDTTQHPRNLTLIFVASTGDGKERGLNRLATRGLVSKAIYAWIGSAPKLAQLVREGAVQAWNLPLGIGTHIWTKHIYFVALCTHHSVAHDPRRCSQATGSHLPHRAAHICRPTQWRAFRAVNCVLATQPPSQGGCLNASTKEGLVQLVTLDGQQRLWYKAPKAIHIAILRGSTADTDGNISMEHEPVFLDQLHQAMAAHNSGGRVIVQVERVVEAGSIPSRLVHIPGALVDKVRCGRS